MQPDHPAHAYRLEGNTRLVELNLKSMDQLFNVLDPSPFRERDLDDDAADYLMDSVRELHGSGAIRIRVHMPTEQPEQDSRTISETVHHYFAYRALSVRQRLRQLLRQGWLSLLIGLVFLAVCLVVAEYLSAQDSFVCTFAGEGFLIVGWVALWRPLEIFLYDWWGLWLDARLCTRIAGLPVEVKPLTPPLSSPPNLSS